MSADGGKIELLSDRKVLSCMQERIKPILEGGILCVVMIIMFATFCEPGIPDQHVEPVRQLSFQGTAVHSGELFDSTDSILIAQIEKRHSIQLTGRFTSEVQKGEGILLKLNNVKCTMKVNGKTVYQSGSEGGFMHAAGNGWNSFACDGISQEDLVEIHLHKMGRSSDHEEFTEFFKELSVGSEQSLMRSLARGYGPALLLSVFILSAGILSFFVGTVLGIIKTPGISRVLSFSLFVIACGTWFVIRNPAAIFLTGRPVFNHVTDVTSQYLITIFGLSYAAEFVSQKMRHRLRTCEMLAIAFSLTAILLQKFTSTDFYDLMPVGVLLNAVFIVIIGLIYGYEAVCLDTAEVKIFLVSAIPVLVGGFAEIVNYALFGQFATTVLFSMGFSVFMVIQLTFFILNFKKSAELAEKAEKMKNELTQSRIAIMLSQIQPHFLFNSLTTIRYLCRKDPQQAEKIVEEFAGFLRGNLENLNTVKLIPFSKELDHLKHFLEIEKVFYEEKLSVVYDIGTDTFKLPCLTVQPIVENAVKYGIGKKVEGGTVTISSRETKDSFLVTVLDDGMGFDPDQRPDDARTHVGIQNVRQRLQQQCGGTLEINSAPGQGTSVSIRIPKDYEERV